MGLFDWLFGKKAGEPKVGNDTSQSLEVGEQLTEDQDWEEIPFYIPETRGQKEVVGVIATAIAAADQPESEFVVTSVKEKNPEATLVSVIAASIMAGEAPESQFVVKRIMQKK